MRIWHIFILFTLCTIVFIIVHNDSHSTTIDYISGIGSIASIYAIIVAIIELKSVKKITEETKTAVNDKLKEINHFLSYADVERHVEMCTSIAPYIQGMQYEAAALHLEELKKALLEIKNNNTFTEKSSYDINQMVMRLGTDITALRSKWISQEEIKSATIITHVNDVSTFLQEISTKLKNQAI